MTLTVATRRWLWIGMIILGAFMIALGAYFLHVGIDQSNKIAGISGPFLSLIGIGIATFSAIQARSTSTASPPSSLRQSQTSGDGSVNFQSGGDITFGNGNNIGDR
ncbi:hypothetical protein ACFWBH_11355 [Streptomyces sp. NPDC059999]|uniref:hypothetical protein n=1 Tax=Streptomyces sp. NPDC059999 TaxID=3347030 RepID=UPI003685F098